MKEIKVKHIFILLIAVTLCLVGCKTFPKAKYLQDPKDNSEGLINFYLQGSLVTLVKPEKRKTTGDTGKTENELEQIGINNDVQIKSLDDLKAAKVNAIVTQTESKKHIYSLMPKESEWLKPNLSVTYFDNTQLVKSIGTNVVDERVKIIESVGAMIVSAITLSVLCGPPPTREKELEILKLPVVIDLSNISNDITGKCIKISGYEHWWYKVLFKSEENPKATVSSDTFFSKYADKHTRSWPYSCCRDISLMVTQSELEPASPNIKYAVFNLRIADPNHLNTINFPTKGNISMHSVCGADVKSEKAEIASTFKVVEAIMKQIEAIKKAQESKQ